MDFSNHALETDGHMSKEDFLRHVRNLNAKWDRRVESAKNKTTQQWLDIRRSMRAEHCLELKALVSEYAAEHGPAALMRRRVKVMGMKRRGLSTREIAEELGVSTRTVQRDWNRALMERGKEPEPQVYRPWRSSIEKHPKIIALWKRGWYTREIARYLKVSARTIKRVIERYQAERDA